MAKRFYYDPDTDHRVYRKDLRNADRETQLRIMKGWFLDNYEKPVQHTPFESAEGGYLYIWGGPYYSESVLKGEFQDAIPPDVIDELATELRMISPEWTRPPAKATFDEHLYFAVRENTRFHETFEDAVSVVERLLTQSLDSSLRQAYYRMLHAAIITALETYLSDAFINTALARRRLLRRFVETDPEFKKRSLTLSEIFKRMSQVKEEIRNYLLELVWHNIGKIKAMYSATLRVKLGDDLPFVAQAIDIRHDLVHRNGRRKDGSVVELKESDIKELIEKARSFVGHIDDQLPRSSKLAI